MLTTLAIAKIVHGLNKSRAVRVHGDIDRAVWIARRADLAVAATG